MTPGYLSQAGGRSDAPEAQSQTNTRGIEMLERSWHGAFALSLVSVTLAGLPASAATDCPNDGLVRFGVEPYEASAHLIPVYEDLGKLLGEKLGCKVEILITTNYTAEIEAMRSGKLEIAQFGPLGYVL